MKHCLATALFAVGVDAAVILSKAELIARILYYSGALTILILTYRRTHRRKK